MIIDLNEKWQQTAGRLGIDGDLSADLFAEIHKRHNERHRRYHGLPHLEALYVVLNPYWGSIHEPARVELAIWYHDIIYNPLGKDNEGKSADLMRERLGTANADDGLIDRVDHLIRATANHRRGRRDYDDNLFLDADFSILGAPTDAYDAYTKAIRKEYRLVPQFIFKRARVEFLRQAIARERIFLTDEFETEYGNQARENMRRELETLS